MGRAGCQLPERPEARILREAAARVADELGLPHDWLNDGAKGFMMGLTPGDVVYESVALLVKAVSIEQLLAMNLAAWRDAIDRADARLLLERLPGTAPEPVWTRLAALIPPSHLDKAWYAFQDLWESVHGSQ